MIQPIALLNATASTFALSPVAIGEAVFDLSLAVLPVGITPAMQPLAAPGNALPPTLANVEVPGSVPALDLAALTLAAAPPSQARPTPTLVPADPMPRASILPDVEDVARTDVRPTASQCAAPITRTPWWRASWASVDPTPPFAPCTRTTCPGRTAAVRCSICHAVMPLTTRVSTSAASR